MPNRSVTGAHLLPAFVSACRDAGARAAVVDLEGAGMDLLRRWDSDARGYHDVEHLHEVLDRLRELGTDDPAARLAAWFHDAVYDGEPGRDEQRSAELARQELSALQVPKAVVDRVAALVLVTTDHSPAPDDHVAAALCDADLAVLAAEPDRYAAYVAGVRFEYRHLDDDTFRAGRRQVLTDLLARPPLFRTEPGRRWWEQRARRNIEAELQDLCG